MHDPLTLLLVLCLPCVDLMLEHRTQAKLLIRSQEANCASIRLPLFDITRWVDLYLVAVLA